MDAKALIRELEMVEKQGVGSDALWVLGAHGGVFWGIPKLTADGRDVLEVLRLGLAAREKQATPAVACQCGRWVWSAMVHKWFHRGTGCYDVATDCAYCGCHLHGDGSINAGPRRLVTPPCPKCGGETGPKWCPASLSVPGYHWGGGFTSGPERMTSVCGTCGYSWKIAALDEQDAQP